MDQFEGSVAVVTGGASGIGLALAEGFAAEKMKVVIADVHQKTLEAAERRLRDRGADVLAVHTDVSDADALEALADATVKRFGKANVLCNNAGVQRSAPTWKLSAREWKWVVDVNLFGVVNGIRAFVPRMLEQGDPCHVVNTASLGGLVTGPLMSAYSATKYAVVGISEAMRMELAQSNVGVSVLCPHFVRTSLGDADRNMPHGLEEGMPEAEVQARREFGKGATALVEAGVSTDIVVKCVIDALRTNRFYVITHPEEMGFFKVRVKLILEAAAEAEALLARK
jgi:NAD(P)-dependent dehydrogenase (short-subunit alcohol dehydrogenase family)